MRKRWLFAGVLAVSLLGRPGLAPAQTVPQTVTFTAHLDSGGVPLAGNHAFDFNLFTAPVGGGSVGDRHHTGNLTQK